MVLIQAQGIIMRSEVATVGGERHMSSPTRQEQFIKPVHYTYVNKTDRGLGLQAIQRYFYEITLLNIHTFFVYSFDLQFKVASRKDY